MPSLSVNLSASRNYNFLAEKIESRFSNPSVLIIGGGTLGDGVENILRPGIDVLETDVYYSERVDVICDGHNLPFEKNEFDLVVAQAVLEHVLEPHKVVSEMHRVTSNDGFVYAETPFMQQVHGGKYDYMRFSHLGHRRLFRDFEEVDSGMAGGPGMALAWAWRYWLKSLTSNPYLRAGLLGAARLTAFWLPLLDHWIEEQPAAMEAASGYYFIGQPSDEPLEDEELLEQYRSEVTTISEKLG